MDNIAVLGLICTIRTEHCSPSALVSHMATGDMVSISDLVIVESVVDKADIAEGFLRIFPLKAGLASNLNEEVMEIYLTKKQPLNKPKWNSNSQRSLVSGD